MSKLGFGFFQVLHHILAPVAFMGHRSGRSVPLGSRPSRWWRSGDVVQGQNESWILAPTVGNGENCYVYHSFCVSHISLGLRECQLDANSLVFIAMLRICDERISFGRRFCGKSHFNWTFQRIFHVLVWSSDCHHSQSEAVLSQQWQISAITFKWSW